MNRPLATRVRAGFRGLAWALGGVSGALCLLVAAWAASNWRDDPPSPVPAVLQPGPPPAGSALFFSLQGLYAPPGVSPEAAGRAAWAAALQRATPSGLPVDHPTEASAQAGRLPALRMAAWACQAGQDCPQRLVTSVSAIALALQGHALLGERCAAALADPAVVYEAAQPPVPGPMAPMPSHFGAIGCGHWFNGQALVAAARGDRQAALQALQQGDRLAVALLVGARDLLSSGVAMAQLRRQHDTVAAVARLATQVPNPREARTQAAWSDDLQALAAPLPPAALDVRRWVVAERLFGVGALDPVLRCRPPNDKPDFWQETSQWLACKTGLGQLPNATRQAIDQRWLQAFQQAEAGLYPALAAGLQAEAAARALPASSVAGGGVSSPAWAWRNTWGQAWVGLTAHGLVHYHAKLADVDLQRQSLALALAAPAVPPAERTAWLAQQNLPAHTRARLRWQAGGTVLTARPWAAELAEPGATVGLFQYTVAAR